VFGDTTLKTDFLVPDLDDCYKTLPSDFVLYFGSNSESIKWHARLGHIGHKRMIS